MCRIPDMVTNIGYVFIPFLISNTAPYSAVEKCFILNVSSNTYKKFLTKSIYIRLISYVCVGYQIWAQTFGYVFIPFTISNPTAYSEVVKCFYIKCNLQYIQNFPIESHLHATHFLCMSRSQTWAQTLDVFIPFTISNTTAYSTVVKSLKINVIFNTYKIFWVSSSHGTSFLTHEVDHRQGHKHWICVIPFTLSNTTAYSTVVKCFYYKCQLQYI